MIDLILLLAGLAALILGSRLSINQAIAIAHHHRLSDVLVGVVILAVGSDLPEIVISVNASLHQFEQTDTSGLIIGNALGSNFSQIGLILGVVGLFGYLTLGRHLVFSHGGILLGALLYLLLASLDYRVSRIEGGVLVVAFLVYVAMLIGQERREETRRKPYTRSAVMVWATLVLGLVLVIGGSEMTVRGTIGLADAFGVSQSLIAIVVLGVGSSLPELTISLAAVLKARGGMSVGNLLGSNIIDTLLPVGLAALIHPLTVEPGLVAVDIPVLFALTLLVLVFLLLRRGIQKHEAVLLILLYVGYLGFKLAGY